MSGFKKCGVFPLNPGEVSDRQLAPSRAFVRSASDSDIVAKSRFTPEDDALYRRDYEKGYDVDDPKYCEWVRLHHLSLSDCASTESTQHSVSVSPSTTSSHRSPSTVSTCAPDSLRTSPSITSVHTAESVSSSEVLSEVLKLPQPRRSKRKAGLHFSRT